MFSEMSAQLGEGRGGVREEEAISARSELPGEQPPGRGEVSSPRCPRSLAGIPGPRFHAEAVMGCEEPLQASGLCPATGKGHDGQDLVQGAGPVSPTP